MSESSNAPAGAAIALALGIAAMVGLLPRERTIRVAIGDDPTQITGWRPEHRAAIAGVLPHLARTGDRWELSDEAHADVIVRPFASERCDHAGEYDGVRTVRLDYACFHGVERLAYGAVHELLHYRAGAGWRFHLCPAGEQAADCHPTVRGAGVLSRALPWEIDGDAYAPPPSPAPTDDDLRLLRATAR